MWPSLMDSTKQTANNWGRASENAYNREMGGKSERKSGREGGREEEGNEER